MRFSNFLIKTTRDVSKNKETKGTENLIRGSFITQVGSGLFSYLPLGYLVLKKIEKVMCEELEKEGVLNILTPVLQPASFWKESGRYSSIGNEMFRIKNESDDYVLAMTAEELFSDIARKYIQSYKDLPLIINQFQTKIRNELRPKGGLMRTKEFIMQDAYSFDIDEKGMDESYKKVYSAYESIFKRLGIDAIPISADVGIMGGKDSLSFKTFTEIGEDKVVYCPKCKYAADQEIAEVLIKPEQNIVKEKSKELIETPMMKTIAEVSQYLKIDEDKTLKSVIYRIKGEKELLMVIIRGDLQINETKVTNFLKGQEFKPAEKEDLDKLGLVTGYISPVKRFENVKVLADYSVKTMKNFVAGANQEDHHYQNVNLGDLKIDNWADLILAEEGMNCSKCTSRLQVKKAIELSHNFKLCTRYSKPMGIIYRDKEDKEQYVQMGCYGIGLGRLVQTCAELFSDDKGIIWPKNIAPFKYYLINIADNPSAGSGQEGKTITEEFYKKLLANQEEVLYDDRNVSPGIKFNDFEMVGAPYRITISNRTLAKNSFEVKERKTGKETLYEIKDFEKVIEKL
jgi:prolyl-tRNA synthetase